MDQSYFQFHAISYEIMNHIFQFFEKVYVYCQTIFHFLISDQCHTFPFGNWHTTILLFSAIATTMIISATFDMQTEKQMLGIQLTNSASAIFNAVTNISNF